jgi:hypothetical protein
MSCKEYKKQIPAVAAAFSTNCSELQEDVALRHHIENCAECTAEFEQKRELARAIDAGVAATVDGEPSPLFLAELRARINREALARHVWPSWISAGIAVTAVLFLCVYVLQHRHAPGSVLHPASDSFVAITAAESRTPRGPARRDSSIPGHYSVDAAKVTRRYGDAPRKPRESRPKQEILVPDNEWAAVLALDAAMRSGQVNGDAIITAARNSEAPLAIEELAIPAIQIAQLDNTGQFANDSDPQ